MRRRTIAFALLTLALTTAAVGYPGPSPARALPRGDWWRARSMQALAVFRAADHGRHQAFDYGMAAGAAGSLYGWTDPRTGTLLTELLATRNPDGGFGLGRAFDAFQDGSVNPPTTTYMVTLAGHVGPTLLAAFRAGAVPRAEVQRIVDLLLRAPRVPVGRGQCVAYSARPGDTAGCVHNVNAGVGWFLQDVAAAGFRGAGLHRLITDITAQELAAYRAAAHWWPYAGDGADQDADHNSYSAESMYRLAYRVGREAAYRHLVTAYADNEVAPIAHVRLVSLPGGPGSMSPGHPGVTLWCELGDRWHAESDAYLAGVDGTRAAQFAYYAARNAAACGPGGPDQSSSQGTVAHAEVSTSARR